MAINDYMVTTLAVDTPDWIVGAIFIAIMVIGAITNAAKELWQKKGETKPGSDRRSPPIRGQSSSHPAGQSRTDQLAAHRRQQLQELARRRTGEQPQSPGQPREPANLTNAQRAEWQRAKARYEQRAQHQAVEQQHPQTDAIILRSKRAIGADLGSHDLGAGVARDDHASQQTHRLVPDVYAVTRRKPSKIAKMLGQKRSLRRAIVLKEILDRPIGLREE